MKLSAMIVYGNAISVLAGLPLFAQKQAAVGTGLNSHSVEKEAALGRQMAAEFRQRTTAIASRSVQDYVENLGRELASQMPASPFSFTFSVIAEDPCPTLHEPYALPGGYVFVPAALFPAAQNEAEFAGMLAHAMAHVVERHATRRATRRELIQAAGIPLVFGPGCASEVAVPVGFLKVQRSFELQADVLAVPTMAKAGFDPNALARYTERVQPQVSATGAEFSPLPPRDERILSILSEIAKLPPSDYTTLPTGEFDAAREEVPRPLPSNRSTPPSLRRKPS
jgi:predicted Zn-dependent protease